MHSHLLDTNSLSDIIRNGRNSRVSQRIAHMPHDSCCTSAIVAAELLYGAEKKGSEGLQGAVKALLAFIPVLPFDISAAENYASVRADLENAGTPIGPNDMLIAAHARMNNLTVVTANEGEFARVPRLKTENWFA